MPGDRRLPSGPLRRLHLLNLASRIPHFPENHRGEVRNEVQKPGFGGFSGGFGRVFRVRNLKNP